MKLLRVIFCVVPPRILLASHGGVRERDESPSILPTSPLPNSLSIIFCNSFLSNCTPSISLPPAPPPLVSLDALDLDLDWRDLFALASSAWYTLFRTAFAFFISLRLAPKINVECYEDSLFIGHHFIRAILRIYMLFWAWPDLKFLRVVEGFL